MLKYIVIDVDGVMTDGGIYYDNHGNEIKKFNVKDAIGFIAAHSVGIKTIVLTGRSCNATNRRMQELKVDYCFQEIKDKAVFLENYLEKNNLEPKDIAYLGDDLNDFPAMQYAGYIGCPADACEEIKEHADYVCKAVGGHGVVREFVEHILKEQGKWNSFVTSNYGKGGI